MRRQRGGWVGWIVFFGVVAAVVFAWPRGLGEKVQAAVAQTGLMGTAAASPKPGASPAAAAREVPVVAARAKKGDLPIHIDGLGTVTPFQTVTVRSRVDGQLMKLGYEEGQDVKVNDLLVEIDPRPFDAALTQAQANKAKDEAQLSNAITDLKRYQEAGSLVPEQQRVTQAALVKQFEAQIKTDDSQIETAKLNLVYCEIRAPISGRVGLRPVDLGNMVHAADPNGLCVITELHPIAVVFSIPQDSISIVMQKMKGGSLPVEAWDKELKNKIADGSLLAIDNEVDVGTGTVKLKGKFANDDNALFPNQFVNARLLVDTLRNTVIIPAAGVQRGPDFAFAYVVKADNTVEMRTIKPGPTEGDLIAISDGLQPGEVVVTDGADKLIAGSKVAAKVAGETPPAGAKDATTNREGHASPAPSPSPVAGGPEAVPALGSPVESSPSSAPTTGTHGGHHPSGLQGGHRKTDGQP